MQDSELIVEVDDTLATIRLSGKPFHTITWDFKDQLSAALDTILAMETVRAVLLVGGPRVFCAGADINVLASLREEEVARRWLTAQHEAVLNLAHFPLPTVAVVEGAAAGAGMNLALACDYIVAGERATFLQAFIGIGLASDMGSLYLLPQRVGVHRARELMYTGRTVRAREALELGIADRLVAAEEDLAEVATAKARDYAGLPLFAFSSIKRGIAETAAVPLAQSLATELDLQVPVCLSADFAEGTEAFLAKRAPNYRDRPHL